MRKSCVFLFFCLTQSCAIFSNSGFSRGGMVQPTWLEWTEWTECSKSCGSGTQIRERSCSFPDSPDIKCFGRQTQSQSCQTDCSIVTAKPTAGTLDIEPDVPHWGTWNKWTDCASSCGFAMRVRFRECKRQVNTNERCQGQPFETETCKLPSCLAAEFSTTIPTITTKVKQVTPYLSNWSDWSSCGVTCGRSVQSRERQCVRPENSFGNCPSAVVLQRRSCDLPICLEPTNEPLLEPYWGDWSMWTSCGVTCGSGLQQRQRECVTPVNSWKFCSAGPTHQQRSCVLPRCSNTGGRLFNIENLSTVDARWSEWTDWSPCNAKCGEAMQSRRRHCIRISGSQSSCPSGITRQERSCDIPSCSKPDFTVDQPTTSLDVTWMNWSPWSSCVGECRGFGTKKRQRTCTYLSSSTECHGIQTNTQSCQPSCETDPYWGEWSSWTECSATCGQSVQIRKRYCIGYSDSKPNCPDGKSQEERDCNLQKCTKPLPQWNDWSTWSKCTRDCDSGVQTRQRMCSVTLDLNPSCIGQSKEERACNTDSCATNAEPYWSEWNEWSSCSATCGKASRTRFRDCIKNFQKGKCKGSKSEKKRCKYSRCRKLISCSVSCGSGVIYSIKSEGNETYRDYEVCNEQSCPQETCTDALVPRRLGPYEKSCCKFDFDSTCGKLPPPNVKPKPQVFLSDSTNSRNLAGNTKNNIEPDIQAIIGGRDAFISEAPWQVYFQSITLLNTLSLCGGTILSDEWILTAAHCVASEDGKKILFDTEQMHVLYGTERIPQLLDLSFLESNIKLAIPHPEYLFPHHDIALLKWTQFVMPACLPGGENPDIDTTCFITGFTVSKSNSVNDKTHLQQADIEVFDNEVCTAGYRNTTLSDFIKANKETLICAGTMDGSKDSCGGDSGGPLVCQRKDSCIFYLAGVTSFGPSPCAVAKIPGVYTKVSYYEDWINETMKKHKNS